MAKTVTTKGVKSGSDKSQKVYNKTVTIEWLNWSEKQNNKPGTKSTVQELQANKLVTMGRAKIVKG